MCQLNLEFQQINPSTQVALFSRCSGNCSDLLEIKWKIYRGEINSSLNNFTDWIPFNPTDHWFFGKSLRLSLSLTNLVSQGSMTSNFTAIKDLFSSYGDVLRWRFEVSYSFSRVTSSSSLNFEMNSPPTNGSCSIHPSNGTTSTPFNVSCSSWFDEDQIKDYSLYSLFNDSFGSSRRTLIGFSSDPSNFLVYLPSGIYSSHSLIVVIRDRDDCLRE